MPKSALWWWTWCPELCPLRPRCPNPLQQMTVSCEKRMNAPYISITVWSIRLMHRIWFDYNLKHVLLCSVDQKHEALLPGNTTPPAGQAGGSKCPFLAAEMEQKSNRVVREARIELQEDVQQMHYLCTGKQSQQPLLELDTHTASWLCKSWKCIANEYHALI